jgi:polar amino acid transport system substrate-binding protein
MKTRTFLRFGAVIAVAGLLAACGSDGSTSSGDSSDPNDLGGRTVTVAVENAYPPFNYINADTNKAEGWDYDVWRAICKEINCKPKFTEAAWDGMIQAVSQDQFDAAADGITITEERAQEVDFSDGYINVEQRLMTNKGEDRYTSLDEFKAGDYSVGTQTGTTNFETATAEYGADRVSGFETFALAVQALLNGDVDAVIIDETAGQGYVGEDADQLELLEGSLSSDELGFIFPKGSDLVAPVNYALAQLDADGTLEQLNAEFFGADFKDPS